MTTEPVAKHPREAVAVISPGQHAIERAGQWTNREAQIIGTAIAPGLTEDDLRVYAAICRHTGLDPFKRQIYAWRDKGRLTIHISIGGWRGLAAHAGSYAGQTPPEWCGPDGQWRDVWLEETPPAAARVGVYRVGNPQPVYAVVTWREFERTQKRTGAKGPTQWDERPSHMLATRSEYHALQKACPEVFAASQEAIRALAPTVTVEAVDDSEIPAPPAVREPRQEEVRTLTEAEAADEDPPLIVELLASAGSLQVYPWESALLEELELASLPIAALEAVVGAPLTHALVDGWLTADGRRTPKSLVSAAADAMAARQEKRR